jgi:hypothetical protein
MNKCKIVPAKTILSGSGAIRIRVGLALQASYPDPVAMKLTKKEQIRPQTRLIKMLLFAQVLIDLLITLLFEEKNMAAGLVSIWNRIRDLSSLNWLHGSICIWICILGKNLDPDPY